MCYNEGKVKKLKTNDLIRFISSLAKKKIKGKLKITAGKRNGKYFSCYLSSYTDFYDTDIKLINDKEQQWFLRNLNDPSMRSLLCINLSFIDNLYIKEDKEDKKCRIEFKYIINDIEYIIDLKY